MKPPGAPGAAAATVAYVASTILTGAAVALPLALPTPQLFDVELSPSFQSKTGTAGSVVQFRVEIRNVGSLPDGYRNAVNESTVPAGWNGTVAPPFVVLYPGHSANLTVNVTIGIDARRGVIAAIQLETTGLVGARDSAILEIRVS